MGQIRQNSDVYADNALGGSTLDTIEEAAGYNRWIVDFFRPYLGETNLELGAGHGTLTAIVAKEHRVIPFEVEETNQRVLSKRFAEHPRIPRCAGDIMQFMEFGSADCIYSSNVLEHILDDLAVIQHCARLLKPGGWFVALVPAGRWLYSEFDKALGHHRRYVYADIERFDGASNADAKLKLRHRRYVNLPGALGWFLQLRLTGRTHINPSDVRKVERLMPAIRLLDMLNLPVGQSLVFALQRI